MKKLNYETSYLYGSKTKTSKTAAVAQEEVEKEVSGIENEIYWTVKSNKHDSSDNPVLRETKKKKKATSVKKLKQVMAEEGLPETFAKFKIDLPKPVKVTIQDALNNIETQVATSMSDDQVVQKNPIPFNDQQIRHMLNFPLVIDKQDLVYDMFSNTPASHFGFTPSVSKILQATMSTSQKNALLQWKNLKIAELGIQGFEELQKSYLNRGKRFHECLQKYFNNEQMTEDDLSIDVIEVWKSISHVIQDFEVPATMTEYHLNHPYLYYKGIVDCVAVHRKTNTLSVIEWKNSDRYKKSVGETYDAPLQLSAYISALNATEFVNNPLTNGIIVVAYNDGQEADMFQLSSSDLKKYFRAWLNRVQDYWVRYRDNTLSIDEI